MKKIVIHFRTGRTCVINDRVEVNEERKDIISFWIKITQITYVHNYRGTAEFYVDYAIDFSFFFGFPNRVDTSC